jgi:putative FmdB family regulatory protein
MPLYSFHCAECDKDSELLMGFSDEAVCPACGGKKMERLTSKVAPDFKLKAKAKIWRAAAEREGHTSNFGKGDK